jgi:hypothetical protein
MTHTPEEWVDRLKCDDLPVLRRTAAELARLATKGDKSSAAEIAGVLLLDPLATLRLLHLANSMRRGRLGTEVTTVEHAVVLLGIPPFFSRFRNLRVVEEEFKDRPQVLRRLLSIMSRSHHAAVQAGEWAALHRDMKAEEVYIAALLRDMAELLCWLLIPEAAQGEVPGAELQPALAEAWHVPELLRELMSPAHGERQRALGVSLAVAVAHHSDNGWHGSELAADFAAVAAFLHLPPDEVSGMIHRSAVAAARRWEWYGVAPAAAWLPMLPGPLIAEPLEQPPAPEAACLIPRHDKLEQYSGEIAAHLDATLNLHDMMALVLKGMHEGIGLNRVVFALLTADRSKVKAKYVLGAEAGSPLRGFEFGMGSAHLYARLMEKMQGVWLNQGNRAKFAPLIPPEIRSLTGDGEFFAMSLFVRDKAVGLFYADRGHGSCALDEHSYQEFKTLCLKAAQGLGHLAKQ